MSPPVRKVYLHMDMSNGAIQLIDAFSRDGIEIAVTGNDWSSRIPIPRDHIEQWLHGLATAYVRHLGRNGPQPQATLLLQLAQARVDLDGKEQQIAALNEQVKMLEGAVHGALKGLDQQIECPHCGELVEE